MARRRDYKQEYQRRQARARSEGWKGYGQKRTAHRRWEDDPNIRRNWQSKGIQQGRDIFPTEEDFSAFYRAFYDKKDSRRRDRNSARAHWFVDVVDKVQSYDDWEERYS